MIRYLAALLVLLALSLPWSAGASQWPNRQQAYEAAVAQAGLAAANTCKYYGGSVTGYGASYQGDWDVINQKARYNSYVLCNGTSRWGNVCYQAGGGIGCLAPYDGSYQWFYLYQECPAGTSWDEGSHTCFDPAQCLAKPAIDYGGTANLSLANGHRCESSCDYTYEGGTVQGITTSGGQAISVGYGGQWKPTGAACTAGDPGAENEGQACITDATSGKSVCINKLGKQCYQLASMTKQVCWSPGETGEKASGAELQKRNVGSTPISPQTLPPDGDTLVQNGTPTTSTTTVNNTTNTTTITNYTTQGGVDVDPTQGDSGVPADGTGDQSGEGQGDEYPVGGTDGTTGAGAGDTSIWKTLTSGDLLGLLDDSGFLPAGAACPPVPVFDFGPLGTFDGNVEGWCSFVDAFGKLLLFMAAIGALTILRE